MSFFTAWHLGVVLSIWSSLAPGWLKILSTSICVCGFAYVMRHHVRLRTNRAVVKIALKHDQKWDLVQRNGVVENVILHGDTVISPFGIILNFKKTKGRVSVLICPDSVGKETFRRLCVQLRTNHS
jgi:hypothetical protein